MRHTLKGLKIGQKMKRWPTGYHYECIAQHDHPKLKGEGYTLFLDEEEYKAIKAIDDLKLPESKAKEVAKIIEEYGSFKYEQGSFETCEDEGI
jgi:hypothetical protein